MTAESGPSMSDPTPSEGTSSSAGDDDFFTAPLPSLPEDPAFGSDPHLPAAPAVRPPSLDPEGSALSPESDLGDEVIEVELTPAQIIVATADAIIRKYNPRVTQEQLDEMNPIERRHMAHGLARQNLASNPINTHRSATAYRDPAEPPDPHEPERELTPNEEREEKFATSRRIWNELRQDWLDSHPLEDPENNPYKPLPPHTMLKLEKGPSGDYVPVEGVIEIDEAASTVTKGDTLDPTYDPYADLPYRRLQSRAESDKLQRDELAPPRNLKEWWALRRAEKAQFKSSAHLRPELNVLQRTWGPGFGTPSWKPNLAPEDMTPLQRGRMKRDLEEAKELIHEIGELEGHHEIVEGWVRFPRGGGKIDSLRSGLRTDAQRKDESAHRELSDTEARDRAED